MPQRIYQDYFKRETAEVAKFVDNLKDNVLKEGGTFDSAAAADFMTMAVNQTTGVNVPNTLQAVLDEVPGDENKALVTRAVLDGVAAYETQHGCEAPADVVEQALHCAYATTREAKIKYGTLDSASSQHHDQISLQPNRAVVAILAAMGEAIPFAHYLPADIGSNEAKLAIMTHHAGVDFGAYKQNALLDGVASGDTYISASRVHTSYPATSDGKVTGKVTKIQASDDTCDPASGDLKLLRGRSLVYIEGRVAAKEVDSSGSGNSTVSGKISVAGTEYAIGGTINTDTGDYTLTTTPKLPDTIPVVVEGFIDFERDSGLTPSIISAVNTFSLFAKPWRVTTHQTVDSRTQMANELGLDPYSESVIAIQAQFSNERHYDVLRKGKRLAAMNTITFDYAVAAQHQDGGRAKIWQDFSYPLGVISQQMAVDTINHGITHLYVGKRIAAQFLGLSNTLFQPSGVAPRPGIYRLGRLFGAYEVYYTPKIVNETETSAQILAVGRATDVTRNPVVLGDAVPPTVIPLAVNADMRQGAGFYARNFTAVNPHSPSSRGFAMIDVINM